jgi:hypothetical protein
MADRPLANIAPYITPWTGEAIDASVIVYSPRGGIGYADETPGDRDIDGVLWTRRSFARGSGVPEYAAVHPQRQRQCMGGSLCQVSGEPAHENAQGNLWLLDEASAAEALRGRPVGAPPICAACVPVALRHCPVLRKGYVLLRVGTPVVAGVHGTVYKRGPAFPVAVGKDYVPYGTPLARWVLAGQLYAHLQDCTPVSLDEVLTLLDGASP